MKLRLTAVGAAMAAMVMVGFGLAPAAQASAWPHGCPSGATCAYPGTNFTGGAGPVYGNNTNDKQYSKWANVESVLNNGTQCTDWVWQNEGYKGNNIEIPIGYQNQNLSGTWAWHHLYSNHWCNPT